MGKLVDHVRVLAVAVAAISLVGVASLLHVGAVEPDVSPLVDQLDLQGPAGSQAFGTQVVVLANGNYVVTDPLWDDGGVADVGAVYLYDGVTNTVISTLTGSTANDLVGNVGVTELTNGNYVVVSPFGDGASAVDVGAVTWGSGTTGFVTKTNSLYGSTIFDKVGSDGVMALSNGNYVVISQGWDGDGSSRGAVTWGSGTTGVSGEVDTDNSLHGTTDLDFVGRDGVTALSNGNYVIASSLWDSADLAAANVGAATWGDGTNGVTGPVAITNSLYGTSPNDNVGIGGVTALANGNYVVASWNWTGGADTGGAATWGDGTAGVNGAVTTSNSLYGTTAFDRVGNFGVSALPTGDFVVTSQDWDNGGAVDAGAATFGLGVVVTGRPGLPDYSVRC